MNDYLQHVLAGQPSVLSEGKNEFLSWRETGEGILELTPSGPVAGHSLVISAGIHGNETAPVEILNPIVSQLLAGERPLAHRLLVIYGNPAALRAGSRFTDYDLNRLFSSGWKTIAPCYETRRASELEQAMQQFMDGTTDNGCCWHLDLHTAIRGSLYQKFGMLPLSPRPWSEPFIDWLNRAGTEALVFHRSPGGTLTHFSCNSLQAESCTLELGKALPFGCNTLSDFSQTQQALLALICGDTTLPDAPAVPAKHFRVAQQITRLSDEFRLHMADSTLNFTEFPAGTLLAEDGDQQYRVESPGGERVLFPNPRVAHGLRAGLMLVEQQ